MCWCRSKANIFALRIHPKLLIVQCVRRWWHHLGSHVVAGLTRASFPDAGVPHSGRYSGFWRTPCSRVVPRVFSGSVLVRVEIWTLSLKLGFRIQCVQIVDVDFFSNRWGHLSPLEIVCIVRLAWTFSRSAVVPEAWFDVVCQTVWQDVLDGVNVSEFSCVCLLCRKPAFWWILPRCWSGEFAWDAFELILIIKEVPSCSLLLLLQYSAIKVNGCLWTHLCRSMGVGLIQTRRKITSYR